MVLHWSRLTYSIHEVVEAPGVSDALAVQQPPDDGCRLIKAVQTRSSAHTEVETECLVLALEVPSTKT
jgi:hypothetical protein